MSTSHLGLMIMFAACVSIVFGTLLRDDTREQVRFAGRSFAGLVVGGFVLGWAMYWVFR
jgi:hypothetical protein